MSEVFFIDKKGNKISCDKVNSHIWQENEELCKKKK